MRRESKCGVQVMWWGVPVRTLNVISILYDVCYTMHYQHDHCIIFPYNNSSFYQQEIKRQGDQITNTVEGQLESSFLNSQSQLHHSYLYFGTCEG